MRVLAVVAAMAVLATAAPARADWQWTHWGMTRDEVVAASGGKAYPLPGSRFGRLTMAGPIQIGNFTFSKANFGFDAAGGLNMIDFSDDNPDFDSLRLSLKAAMGPPVKIDRDTVAVDEYYSDPSKNNTIILHCLFPDSVSLTYQPLPPAF